MRKRKHLGAILSYKRNVGRPNDEASTRWGLYKTNEPNDGKKSKVNPFVAYRLSNKQGYVGQIKFLNSQELLCEWIFLIREFLIFLLDHKLIKIHTFVKFFAFDARPD